MKLIPLEEYLKMNEDFYNPFDEEDAEAKKKPIHLKDTGGNFEPRKESFNLARIEWTKRPGGDYSLISKTQFARGELIEVCPLIILPDIVKTIDRLKDIVFEIDKKKGEYGLVLGYGSMYRHSDKPNVDYAFNKRQRHMFFIANRTIQFNEELTINYGTEYWSERSNLNLMSEVPNISVVKEPDVSTGLKDIEESEIQPNAADIEQGKTNKAFGEPNSKINPAISGVVIGGLGQQ
jgi:hypothetical protein